MSSVARRGDGRWRARYRDQSGHEHARHFARKVDAQAWLDSVTAAVQTGSYVDPKAGRILLGDYTKRWLDHQVHLKPSTRSRYAAIIRVHIQPRFGLIALAAVDRSHVSAWVTELTKSGLAGATVRHVYRVLHSILHAAVLDGRIVRNPASDVKLPRGRSKEKRFLTHDEVASLADAAGADRLIILMLAYCGLRFGELAALRVRNVDFLRKRLIIEQSATEVDGVMIFGAPKSHQRREVAVPRFLVEGVAGACVGKSRDDLLFTSRRGGVIYLRNWRARVFDPSVRQAGLGSLSPHELRHTAASLAVAAGANVKAVQRMLGHASAAMTLDTYSGLFEDDLDAVADRLDEALRRTDAGVTADYLRTANRQTAHS